VPYPHERCLADAPRALAKNAGRPGVPALALVQGGVPVASTQGHRPDYRGRATGAGGTGKIFPGWPRAIRCVRQDRDPGR
jgi:hypothetical protein